MAKMCPVVHFEMPGEDMQRMKDFYSKAFGWQMNQMGSDMGDYVVVTTTKVDQKTSRPTEPGAINGGLYKKGDDESKKHPSVVIAVDDLEESMKKVTELGGKVLHGPDDIPGVGKYATFVDTEGNPVSMLQPAPMMPDLHK